MPARLKKYSGLLKALCKAKPKQRKLLLKKFLCPDLVKCLSECSHNILAGNVKLTSGQKKKLLSKKKALRDLANKKISIKRKKKIIQTGGFLQYLITPLLSVLGNLFGGNK